VLLALAAVLCVSLLGAFWVADGQFRGW
jgi:hypothetical protein